MKRPEVKSWPTVRRRVDELNPAAYNPRSIDVAASAGLRASLKRFGMVQPIVVNKRTGNMVGGHQRHSQLQKLGVVEVDVVEVDLSLAQEKALNVALNSPHLQGRFTDDLGELLKDIAEEGRSLMTDLRFDDLAADFSIDLDFAAPSTPKAKREPSAERPAVRSGEVYSIGRHALAVVDCRASDPFAELPPWDCAYFDPMFQWDGVYAWLPPVRRGSLIVLADPFRIADAILAAHAAGWTFRSEMVWDGLSYWEAEGKPRAQHKVALLFGDFTWAGERTEYELDGETRRLTSVYRAANSGIHGGRYAKPLDWTRALLAGVGATEVYDLGVGSGTTILAAEQLGIRVRGCEVNPENAAECLARCEAGGLAFGLVREVEVARIALPKTSDPRRYARGRYYRSAEWITLRAAALKRAGGKCEGCGEPHGVRAAVDHVKRREEGGEDAMSNLQVLCRRCHAKKSAIEGARA